MSAPAGHHFPSPVGGAPFAFDFVPSVLFAALYAALAPLILWRGLSSSSRSVMLIGSVIFGLERSLDFVLRALEARSASDRVNRILVTYMQTTYASGFISMGQTLLILLQCLLVHAVKGEALPMRNGYIATDTDFDPANDFLLKQGDTPSANWQGELSGDATRRIRFIKIGGISIALWYWTAFGMSLIWGSIYYSAITNPQKAREVELLRYIATGFGLFLLQVTNVTSLVAMCVSRHVPRFHALYISGIACLLSVTATYRMVVMRCQTVALESTAACSLNNHHAKVMFYVFHIVPELLSVILLFSFNLREMYKTGVWGHG